MQQDVTEELAGQVQQAFVEKQALRISGGGSKLSLGREVLAQSLDVTGHRGIIDYAPTELVITARAGTPLTEVNEALAEFGQMLPFEPPHMGKGATLGGTIACGLSGPRRPYAGSARDFTLGIRIINGQGEVLSFGGQVMKNVAGYDVSRLTVGAQGTLGVILDVSMKVLPRPACERTLQVAMDAEAAIKAMTALASSSLPLSAACHVPATTQQPAQLHVRLSGEEEAVVAAIAALKKDLSAFSVTESHDGKQAHAFWQNIRERDSSFFTDTSELWRLSLPPATADLSEKLPGDCLLDWGGAQRWLKTEESAEHVCAIAQELGGHATVYGRDNARFMPLNPVVAKLHANLKTAFDPEGILNPGRLYEGL